MKPTIKVKIGTIQDPRLYDMIEEVVVDTNYYLPTMFTIRLSDPRTTIPAILQNTDNVLKYAIGAKVEISFGQIKGKAPIPIYNLLVKGEITSIEPIFVNNNVSLILRGYDKGHRLTRGKWTRTYGDGSPIGPGITDADIVKKIAKDAGLSASIDTLRLMPVRYNYVMQYNQNDWDFLWARARNLGYQVYVDGDKLCFKTADSTRGLIGPDSLLFGKNLRRFEPKIASMGQTAGSEAYGWDPNTKTGVSAKSVLDTSLKRTVTPANLVPPNLAVKKAVAEKAGSIIVDPTFRNMAQATIAANASFSRTASSFIRATGELYEGDPFLVAGTMVKIGAVGIRFAGLYFVTEAHHVFRDGNYRVTFGVSGQKPTTFRSLILGSDQNHVQNKIDGMMTGIVTSNVDPQSLGRVKVKFPWLPKYNSAVLSSAWARLAIQGGGKNRGILFIPEVDDEVLVAFENGDPSLPYVVGTLYNLKDKPPKGKGTAVDPGTKKVNERIICSRSGHKIILDDSAGKEKVIILDKTGNNSITIDSVKNTMEIKTKGNMTIDVGGKLDIKSKADTTVDAGAKLGLNAKTSADINAKSAVAITGNQKVSAKAGPAALELQASGTTLKGMKVDVQGTSVSVKGTAMVQIQGGIVKIN